MKLLPLFEYIVKSNLKGRNLLYHSTPLNSAIDILHANKIIGMSGQTIKTKLSTKSDSYDDYTETYGGVSLTRDWQFKYGAIQFILDGDLLKRNFGSKIVPFDYFSNKTRLGRSSTYNESEEFLIGDVNPLNKYLLGIRIVDEFDFSNHVLDNQEALTTFQNIIKTLNVPVYNVKFQDYTQEILDPNYSD